MAEHNPYSAPSAKLDYMPGEGKVPPLWNPNAAVNWSLLLTPVFGAYLVLRNWQALGEAKKVRSAHIWLALWSLFMLGWVGALITGLGGPQFVAMAPTIAFFVLLIWYFASARRQAQYVKQRFGSEYPRQGWWWPLLAGFAGLGLLIMMPTFF